MSEGSCCRSSSLTPRCGPCHHAFPFWNAAVYPAAQGCLDAWSPGSGASGALLTSGSGMHMLSSWEQRHSHVHHFRLSKPLAPSLAQRHSSLCPTGRARSAYPQQHHACCAGDGRQAAPAQHLGACQISAGADAVLVTCQPPQTLQQVAVQRHLPCLMHVATAWQLRRAECKHVCRVWVRCRCSMHSHTCIRRPP